MTVNDAQQNPAILLIHGTFAGEADDAGPAWWQIGSVFRQQLHSQLKDFNILDVKPFRWSGLNSERERRLAGERLAEFLSGLESTQTPYHIIAHSHGGSVVWHALCHALRDYGEPRCCRSWTTVGTPFIHLVPRNVTLEGGLDPV